MFKVEQRIKETIQTLNLNKLKFEFIHLKDKVISISKMFKMSMFKM